MNPGFVQHSGGGDPVEDLVIQARQWEERQEFDKAVRCWADAFMISENPAYLYFQAMLQLYRLKKPQQALRNLNSAISRLEDPGYVAAKATCLLALNRPEEALESFTRALAIEPHPNVLAMKARCLERLGRTAEAQSALAQVSRVDPSGDALRFAEEILKVIQG